MPAVSLPVITVSGVLKTDQVACLLILVPAFQLKRALQTAVIQKILLSLYACADMAGALTVEGFRREGCRAMAVTFPVSPDVSPPTPKREIDHAAILRRAFRRPVEAIWQPEHPLIWCGEAHAFVSAASIAFYLHHPLVLSPDVIWLTLARGFALHVNLNAEKLRHRFVAHAGKEKIEIERPDFFPGADNPWPEAFGAFSAAIAKRVGKLRDFVRCDFSTTGPVELAVSDLMVMDAFQTYFEYKMLAGCGIPAVTLTGDVQDWKSIRDRAALFGEFGLEEWAEALDPILRQFVAAVEGHADVSFWQSFFRYHSGSGASVMTGWINAMFPYFKDHKECLYANPYLKDWQRRLEIDDRQHWLERSDDPQGVGIRAIPSALASAPVKIVWGDRETDMRFVGGLIGVSQRASDLAVQPQCGWAVLYEEPVVSLLSEPAGLEPLADADWEAEA